MTQSQWSEFEQTIAVMSQSDRLELIERVARVMRSDGGVECPTRAEPVATWLARIAALPLEQPESTFSGPGS